MALNEATGSTPWEGTAYAQHSGHHRAVDDWFLARHPPGESDVVLDLGCGSGEFTAKVAELVPGGRVIGVDADASMLEAAGRHAAPNLSFVASAAQDVDRVIEPGSVDLVLSRAMLHWLPRDLHPRLFEAIRTVLRPGGVVHVEGGGAGNIPRVLPLLQDLADDYGLGTMPPFPDPGTELEIVEAAGLEVDAGGVSTIAQRRPFTRDELVGFLHSQATLVLTQQVSPSVARQIVADAVAGIERLRRHDGTYDQTFVRLEVLARRPR